MNWHKKESNLWIILGIVGVIIVWIVVGIIGAINHYNLIEFHIVIAVLVAFLIFIFLRAYFIGRKK